MENKINKFNNTIQRFSLNKVLIILSLLWIGFQLVQLDNSWTRMDDDAHFLLHARSLVVNHLYNDPHFVYMDQVDYIPKNTSPGWPLMLVPIIFLFGTDILILKITPLARKSVEDVKKAVNEIYGFTQSIGGDIARLGEERVVIVPNFIKIWRQGNGVSEEKASTAA